MDLRKAMMFVCFFSIARYPIIFGLTGLHYIINWLLGLTLVEVGRTIYFSSRQFRFYHWIPLALIFHLHFLSTVGDMKNIFEYLTVLRHTNRFIEACSLRLCFLEVLWRLIHLRFRSHWSFHRWHLKYITRWWACVIIIQPVVLVYHALETSIMTLDVLISSKHALWHLI